ncbi:MAG: glutathione S-transferase, partial [Sphingomonas sp.]|nr:glutathione S-transferase [Sphingomonas sp.]
RLPYVFLPIARARATLPQPKVPLLPTFYFDGAPVTDSTPIIRRLEADYADRPIVPADPALALIDALIEDYGDEWLTKAMFHYRWSYAADIRKSAEVLPNWHGGPLDGNALAAMGKTFADRQISRLAYVGSNPATGPVIEGSYRRLLTLLDAHFAQHRFLLGDRPAPCDFALYGQLTQLALFDPTPMALASDIAPRVVAWSVFVEDLSGEDATAWFTADALPATLTALLGEIGRTYAPLLLANAHAVMAGAERVTTVIDGQTWDQAPFPYQAKCLKVLRDHYVALGQDARATVDAALAGTGCEALFA